MKIKQLFLGFLLAGLLIPLFVFAGDLPTITLFYGEECPHCHTERAFLNELKKEMPNLEIVEYEVWHNEENRKLFLERAQSFGVKNTAVPFTVIGDKYIIGFDNPQNIGEKIRRIIEEFGSINADASGNNSFFVPFFGKIDFKNGSLPFLTAALGTADGFNPCSMWSLLVMLTLVIATGSRKKVWLVGWTFIITSSISYFIFMSAWLNIFIFLGYLMIIKIIVGLVAVVSGAVSIREFYTFKPNVCEVGSSEEQKNKITKKIEQVVASPKALWLVLGVAGIAFSVNLIEMMCSLGLPVVFTKTLTMYQLAPWKYYGYILLYVFFYMILNILVVLAAGFTMKFLHITDKYSRWFRLFAGILMLILGAIFLLKPELLMFTP